MTRIYHLEEAIYLVFVRTKFSILSNKILNFRSSERHQTRLFGRVVTKINMVKSPSQNSQFRSIYLHYGHKKCWSAFANQHLTFNLGLQTSYLIPPTSYLLPQTSHLLLCTSPASTAILLCIMFKNQEFKRNCLAEQATIPES